MAGFATALVDELLMGRLRERAQSDGVWQGMGGIPSNPRLFGVDPRGVGAFGLRGERTPTCR